LVRVGYPWYFKNKLLSPIVNYTQCLRGSSGIAKNRAQPCKTRWWASSKVGRDHHTTPLAVNLTAEGGLLTPWPSSVGQEFNTRIKYVGITRRVSLLFQYYYLLLTRRVAADVLCARLKVCTYVARRRTYGKTHDILISHRRFGRPGLFNGVAIGVFIHHSRKGRKKTYFWVQRTPSRRRTTIFISHIMNRIFGHNAQQPVDFAGGGLAGE